jgi:manganese/zinc/iron transport system ATP- binding protein
MLKASNSILTTPDGVTLLKEINFEITGGKLTYLHGPNGVGKTSLIKAILGIELDVSSIENTFETHFYLPQIENKEFMLPIQIKEVSSFGPFLEESERKTLWNKASGGQRKKALVERAIIEEAQLYILDEPYNHLDTKTIALVNKEMQRLVKLGKCILMISHKKPDIDEELMVSLDVSQWI